MTSTASVETAGALPARQEPTTVEKLRGLPWSIFSNSANTVYAQFTFFGSVFVLFLSDLGMNKSQIGFLLSLIPFAGLVALFLASPVARFGYKRTFIVFFTLRKVITIGLLFTPLVAARYGAGSLAAYVTVITGGFALCRAIAETGVYPWLQEYIPNSVRGKYSATNSIYTTLVGLASVAIAGYVLDVAASMAGYLLLIGVGVAFGFVSAWAATRIPGGAPVRRAKGEGSVLAGMAAAARDKNFLRYLAGAALLTLGSTPMVSFLPLFMQEQVRLSDGAIVLLQAGTLVGNLVSSLPWGWASDRYGSKPVMISGLAMKLALPVLWFTMPRQSAASLYVALGIALVLGISDMAWGIGAGRLLFVSVVPPEKKTEYMALHYAWIGVIGGVSQLLGGSILDFTAGLSGTVAGVTLDPYTPLFGLGLALPLAALLLLMRMRADNIFGVGEFAGMFFRGNPFLAMGALVRYYMAKEERDVVEVTERMGLAKSPLAVDELLEALKDPRFNVRFEAVVAIARMPADARLTEALVEVLNGTELALKVVAAWALGRIGDRRALEPLRHMLDADYRSLRAYSARALGALRDRTVAPVLLERLETEEDKGLQMAYASALGNLRAEEAAPRLLALLRTTQNAGARMELALSLARIVGDEQYFIHLLRQARADLGTAAAQAIGEFRRRLRRSRRAKTMPTQKLAECADRLARGEVAEGSALLGAALRDVPEGWFGKTAATILAECAERLAGREPVTSEYLLLALHVMVVGLM